MKAKHDETLEEIWAIRHQIAKKFRGDPQKRVAYYQRKQNELGMKIDRPEELVGAEVHACDTLHQGAHAQVSVGRGATLTSYRANRKRKGETSEMIANMPNKLLLLLCALLLSCSSKSNEPTYQGRVLSEWLTDYSNPLKDGDPRDPKMQTRVPQRLQAAQQAVKAIGTNAIPTLLELIQSSDAKRRDMAYAGFMLIGRAGSPATQPFLALTRHEDAHVRLLAAECMVFIDPADKKTLIPIFTQLSSYADLDNRIKATNYLQILTFNPHP